MALASVFALVLSAPVVAGAQATPVASPVIAGDSLELASAWLIAQQDASGAFLGFSGEPDPGTTVDAVLALASLGGGSDTLDAAVAYIKANGADYAGLGAGQAAKLVLALVATGQDPADVGGVNPVELVTAGIDEDSGLCGIGVFDHAICILAIAATGGPVPAEWTEALVSFQIENGGWAFDGSQEAAMADSNTTAVAVQALVATGMTPDQAPVQQALAYLATVLAPGGGFAYAVADPLIPDANSTGSVIQALIAAGEDPASAEWGNSLAVLAGFQNQSGAFRYMDNVPDDNLFATVQAMPALAGTPFPILAS